MVVDLRILESRGKSAVRCTSEEQAKMFMDAMWEQYPEKVKGIWRRGQTNWDYQDYIDLGEICYKHRIGHRDVFEVDYCQSGKVSSARSDGYEIIEFESLLPCFDLGELPSPEFDIKSLFDMG